MDEKIRQVVGRNTVELSSETTYYRYISEDEKKYIENRMGSNSSYVFNKETPTLFLYFTTEKYDSADLAKSMLALDTRPQYRIAFSIPNAETIQKCQKGIIALISHFGPVVINSETNKKSVKELQTYELGGGVEYIYEGALQVILKGSPFALGNHLDPKSLWASRLDCYNANPSHYGMTYNDISQWSDEVNSYINEARNSDHSDPNKAFIEVEKRIKHENMGYEKQIKNIFCLSYLYSKCPKD